MGYGKGFAVKDTYMSHRSMDKEVEWYKLIRNKFNSPREKIHAWLVAMNRLLTKDRMEMIGFAGCQSCVLCEQEDECRDHLFCLSVVSPKKFRVRLWLSYRSVVCHISGTCSSGGLTEELRKGLEQRLLLRLLQWC